MKPVQSILLKNSHGDQVTILTLGARLHQWLVNTKQGVRNIVVGYDNIEDYRNDDACMGAIAGPYANRIGGSETNIGGKTIKFPANEGQNLLHGGDNSLDTCHWSIKHQSDNLVILRYEWPDMRNGFPGPIIFDVTYDLSDSRELSLLMDIESAQETVVGPTGHAYFNLAGNDSDIFGHHLRVDSRYVTSVDEQNIPTGIIDDIANSPIDFTAGKQLTESEHALLDLNFVMSENWDESPVVLTSPSGDLALHIHSDYPGLQIYTAGYLGHPFNRNQGVCLEPQFFPDAPNKTHFKFESTTPKSRFKKSIRYQLVE